MTKREVIKKYPEKLKGVPEGTLRKWIENHHTHKKRKSNPA